MQKQQIDFFFLIIFNSSFCLKNLKIFKNTYIISLANIQ